MQMHQQQGKNNYIIPSEQLVNETDRCRVDSDGTIQNVKHIIIEYQPMECTVSFSFIILGDMMSTKTETGHRLKVNTSKTSKGSN